MIARLEIERLSGIDERRVDGDGIVDGACPGCDATPFRIGTHPPVTDPNSGERSGARCLECNDAVGWVYIEPNTIFGEEEDRAVFLHGRARVYGGGVRP